MMMFADREDVGDDSTHDMLFNLSHRQRDWARPQAHHACVTITVNKYRF